MFVMADNKMLFHTFRITCSIEIKYEPDKSN